MLNPISRSTWNSMFSDPSRHPHYDVAGTAYYSKLDAACATKELSLRTGEHIRSIMKFRCFDSVLSKLDFSQEPTETYQELCIRRARQLRLKYRYIRLWYSGGVDSHMTLMSLYKAGVSPDEVCFMTNRTWETSDPGADIEYRTLTEPVMQAQIRQMFPTAKQRIIPFTSDFWASIDKVNFQDVLFKACVSFPMGRDIPTAYEIQPDLFDAVSQHGIGNVCELVGEPKVFLFKKRGEWWASIADTQIINMMSVPNIEMFHLSPDFPDIYIKQCHMVKRGLEPLMMGREDDHSLVLDKDFLLKNRLMQRRNEYDIAGVNAVDTSIMKGRTETRERVSVVLNGQLMNKNDNTKKIWSALTAIWHKDMLSYLEEFMDPSDAVFKDFISFHSNAWCLDKKKTMLDVQIWPKGYGVYE